MREPLREIRAAIADALNRIEGIQAVPYMLFNPTPPSAHVFPTPVEYDMAFGRGSDRWTFTVQVFVGEPGDQAAQVNLDRYLEPFGPSSVKQQLERRLSSEGVDRDDSLDGVIEDLHVVRAEGYQRFLSEGRGPVLGSSWILAVIAPGNSEEA